MKKLLSRFIAVNLIASVLIFNPTTIARATTGDIEKHVNLNKDQMLLLEQSNINLEDIVLVDKNAVFSDDELDKMEEEDQKLEAKGLVKDSEVFYIKSNDSSFNLNPKANVAAVGGYDTIIYNTRSYTSVSEKADGVTGMATLLDITFNIWIGSVTKVAWKATTLLGLNPSSFMTSYYTGDLLTETNQFIYNDKYYCMYDKDKQYWPLVRTTQLNLATYVDLYTRTSAGTPYRDSEVLYSTKYTSHYNDTSWILSEVAVNKLYNGMVVTYDKFD